MRTLIRAQMQAEGGFARPEAGQAPGVATADRNIRQAAVFVLVNGVPEARVIGIGLNDWDNTEVVSGLEGDEELAVIGAAQLQAQQAEFLERIRSRTGGSPFGGAPGMGRR